MPADIYLPVRGKQFPSLVKRDDNGHTLCIPVPGPWGSVAIAPPRDVVPEETNIWPTWAFQLLLVASEYCAALLEFMTWAFPEDWAPLKAQVAGYARQLIRTSTAVPRPDVQPSGEAVADDRARSAHGVWAAFTHCYFHGLTQPEAEASQEGSQELTVATRWLRRLVGGSGWQEEGPVYLAVEAWVEAMLERLQAIFPEIAQASAREWAAGAAQDGRRFREVGSRGDLRLQDEDGSYLPMYPLRMTAERRTGRSQLKWTLLSQKAPRTVAGSCGVPHDFTQTNNCALGYLVLADAIEAFCQAFRETIRPALEGKVPEQQEVIMAFIESVISSDSKDLTAEHKLYGYLSYLASCALGWKLALQQLTQWLAAAGGGLAPAAPMTMHRELIMPRDIAAPAVRLQPQPSQFEQSPRRAPTAAEARVEVAARTPPQRPVSPSVQGRLPAGVVLPSPPPSSDGNQCSPGPHRISTGDPPALMTPFLSEQQLPHPSKQELPLQVPQLAQRAQRPQLLYAFLQHKPAAPLEQCHPFLAVQQEQLQLQQLGEELRQQTRPRLQSAALLAQHHPFLAVQQPLQLSQRKPDHPNKHEDQQQQQQQKQQQHQKPHALCRPPPCSAPASFSAAGASDPQVTQATMPGPASHASPAAWENLSQPVQQPPPPQHHYHPLHNGRTDSLMSIDAAMSLGLARSMSQMSLEGSTLLFGDETLKCILETVEEARESGEVTRLLLESTGLTTERTINGPASAFVSGTPGHCSSSLAGPAPGGKPGLPALAVPVPFATSCDLPNSGNPRGWASLTSITPMLQRQRGCGGTGDALRTDTAAASCLSRSLSHMSVDGTALPPHSGGMPMPLAGPAGDRFLAGCYTGSGPADCSGVAGFHNGDAAALQQDSRLADEASPLGCSTKWSAPCTSQSQGLLPADVLTGGIGPLEVTSTSPLPGAACYQSELELPTSQPAHLSGGPAVCRTITTGILMPQALNYGQW